MKKQNPWLLFVATYRSFTPQTSYKKCLQRAKPLYRKFTKKMRTMKGGSECICDIDRIIEFMKGSCKNCTLNKRRQGDTRSTQSVPTMQFNAPPPSRTRELSSLTHEEVLIWLRNERLKVYADHIEKLKTNAWYLGPPANGQTLVDECASDSCESLAQEGQFLKARGVKKKVASRVQRLKFVRVLRSALTNGIPLGKLKKRD